MTNPVLARRTSATAIVVAVPLAVAWILGPFDSTDDPHPDYALRAPELPGGLGHVIGILAVLTLAAAVAGLVWSWRIHSPIDGFLRVLTPLVILGVIVGYAWRVMTAAVIGANIGAGLLVLFAGPVVVALVFFAVAMAFAR